MNLANAIGYRLINAGNFFTQIADKQQGRQMHDPETYNKYIAEDPEEFLRITYPLNKNSLVIDLGGYKGEWSARIFAKYACKIRVYEPHPEFYMTCREALNPSIVVFNFGLGSETKIMHITDDTVYSTVKESGELEVAIEKASEVFNLEYVNGCDLLKINIEGGEYDVLPDLIANYDTSKLKNIQVQFHNFVPDYKKKYADICAGLEKTHVKNWGYDFLYENWRVK